MVDDKEVNMVTLARSSSMRRGTAVPKHTHDGGARLQTSLANVGSAISVLTKELISDIGGYNNQTVSRMR